MIIIIVIIIIIIIIINFNEVQPGDKELQTQHTPLRTIILR